MQSRMPLLPFNRYNSSLYKGLGSSFIYSLHSAVYHKECDMTLMMTHLISSKTEQANLYLCLPTKLRMVNPWPQTKIALPIVEVHSFVIHLIRNNEWEHILATNNKICSGH